MAKIKLKKYYDLHMKDNETGSVAKAPEDCDFSDYFDIKKIRKIEEPFVVDEGTMEDFLANDVGWPLLSARMKYIFEEYSSRELSWVPLQVQDKRVAVDYQYFVLYFENKLDVLDTKETSYGVEGVIMIPVFSLKKVSELDFFPQPEEYDFNLVISENLKRSLEKAGISGIDFSEAYITA